MESTIDFPFDLGAAGLLDGRYRVKSAVGSGGTSRVFRALDIEDERPVAIKVLSPRRDMDESTINVFYDREFRSGRKLSHPNIAELLGAGRIEGIPYLIFEWLPKSLEDVLRGAGPQKWERFADRYALPILEALSYAHDQGVYHRDINLRNIRLSEDATPKITDFGIATLLGAPPAGITIADFRTAPFSPPASEDDASLPATRDMYSYGAVVLFGLSGVDPFTDQFSSDRYAAIESGKHALRVAPQIRGFINACLDRSPSARPRTATAALADLKRAIASASGRAPAPTYHFWVPPKIKLTLQLALGTEDADGAVARIEEDLDGDVAVLLRGTPDDADERLFDLIGSRFQVSAGVDRESEDRFVFLSVKDASYFQLERARDTAYHADMHFVPGIPKNQEKARSDIRDLAAAVAGHESERIARERAQEHGKVVGVWRRCLQLRSDIDRFKEDPLEYVKATVSGSELVFEMKHEVSYELVGQARQVATARNRPIGGEVIDARDHTVVVAHRYGELQELPRAGGRLRLDMYLSRLALRRQEAALDTLSERRAVRRDLLELLTDPARARAPADVGTVTFRQQKLDSAKQRAVATGLGTTDLFAVHGPPGTGKTTFITELILQYRMKRPTARILVASQTHTALDNVLERLQQLDNHVRLLRLARPGEVRVSPAVEPYLFHQQLARWQDESVTRGREFVRSWAKSRGLDVRNVELAAQFEQLAALREVGLALSAKVAELAEDAARSREDTATTTRLELDRTDTEEALRQNGEAQRGILLLLTRMGAISAQKELPDDPSALRERAAALVPGESESYRQCLELLKLQADWQARFGHGEEFTVALLSRSEVVAATCVGLPGFRGAELVEFDLCIVDEASKATPTETLIPMVQAQRWVVVGDPNQLPPYLETTALREVRPDAYGLSEADLRGTLLDHLLVNLPEHSRTLLSEQHRMVHEIGTLISHCFYGGALTNGPVEPIPWLSRVFEKNVVWFTTTGKLGAREFAVGTSYTNDEEQRVVRQILLKLNSWATLAGHKTKLGSLSVGVLAAYRAQRDRLARELYPAQLSCDQLQIEVGTVDAFQGRETDVLIYSVTRSNTRGELGFLREPSRLNVALSRGRKALVIVGDLAFVKAAHDPDGSFDKVVNHIDTHPEDCAVAVWDPS